MTIILSVILGAISFVAGQIFQQYILAPIQEWRGMKKFRRIVYAGQRDEAALLQCGWLIEYFQEVDIPIHPNLRQTYQVLLTKLEIDETFFERW